MPEFDDSSAGVPYAITGIADLIAAAAATQLIAADTPCRSVTVRSLRANVGIVRVAGATAAINIGVELSPGDSITIDISNVSFVYIFGNGADIVSVTYVL